MSLLYLVSQAGPVVKFIMILLLIFSVYLWGIVISKFFSFYSLSLKSDKFEKFFNSFDSLDSIFSFIKKEGVDDHFAQIFVSAMKEWELSGISEDSSKLNDNIKSSIKERIYDSTQIKISKSISKLKGNIHHLAIIGSAAPFLGLLGTVWGIMNSFREIAVHKTSTLTVVAPGVAEALLATAAGLFVAIPAIFFYNIYSNRINFFENKLEDFSILIMNFLSREMD